MEVMGLSHDWVLDSMHRWLHVCSLSQQTLYYISARTTMVVRQTRSSYYSRRYSWAFGMQTQRTMRCHGTGLEMQSTCATSWVFTEIVIRLDPILPFINVHATSGVAFGGAVSSQTADRWLSLTLGKPVRINLDDSDVTMASAGDVVDDLSGLPGSIAPKFMPDDLPQLAEHWVLLIKLRELLGDVLTLTYQPRGVFPSLDEMHGLEADLIDCKIPEQPEPRCSPRATFSLYHLQLHYQLRPPLRIFDCS